jgi:hypothetical protein
MGEKIKSVGSRAEVFHGNAKQTKGGLTKKDLILKRDKYGNERYKSRHQQKVGHKKNTFRAKWTKAMKQARKELIKEGVLESGEFVPVGGKTKQGKALYKRTKEIME